MPLEKTDIDGDRAADEVKMRVRNAVPKSELEGEDLDDWFDEDGTQPLEVLVLREIDRAAGDAMVALCRAIRRTRYLEAEMCRQQDISR